MDNETLVAQDNADLGRSIRMFANLVSTALGATPDQNYASEDAYIGNGVGQHAAADPYRGSAVQGRAEVFGNTVAGGFTITPGLVLLLVAGWFLLKKA
jgi:hypothetical protein